MRPRLAGGATLMDTRSIDRECVANWHRIRAIDGRSIKDRRIPAISATTTGLTGVSNCLRRGFAGCRCMALCRRRTQRSQRFVFCNRFSILRADLRKSTGPNPVPHCGRKPGGTVSEPCGKGSAWRCRAGMLARLCGRSVGGRGRGFARRQYIRSRISGGITRGR